MQRSSSCPDSYLTYTKKYRFKNLTWMSSAEADTQVLNMDAKDVAMVGPNEGAPEGVDITVDNGGGGGAKKVR